MVFALRAAARDNRASVEEQPVAGNSAEQEAFAEKAGQLGIEVASINGIIGDLVELNERIVGDLQSVVEAVRRNSDSNQRISAAVDRTRDMAARAEIQA